MSNSLSHKIITISALLSLILSTVLTIYAYNKKLFSSQEAFQNYIAGFGLSGLLVFVLFQIVQVILPILPGSLGCLVGVLMFGKWWGFLYNYIGICIGSIAAFLIAKQLGKPVLYSIFSRKMIEKYERWTGPDSNFTKLFAIAIFMPVAPDDFLCYLAGTTPMSLKTFIPIILLGKPAAIALYSFGLHFIFQQIISHIH